MRFPLTLYKIVGHSMLPTLKPGQVVWVFTWAYFFNFPKVGDIVVFEEKGKQLVKRVGEVRSNKLFLVGDNSEDSLDSRRLGFIDLARVVGKVILKKQKAGF